LSAVVAEHFAHGDNEQINMLKLRQIGFEALCEMVRREFPASVYRCKGIVYAADAPEKRLTLRVEIVDYH